MEDTLLLLVEPDRDARLAPGLVGEVGPMAIGDAPQKNISNKISDDSTPDINSAVL